MVKALSYLLLLLVSSIFILLDEADAAAAVNLLQPRPFNSINVGYIQNLADCAYTVNVTTSCSSPRYTSDQIGITFGDADGSQVYAPELVKPSSLVFERCSSDIFHIKGPCADQVCYAYLYRNGTDGWKPESVQISGADSEDVTFYFDKYLPSEQWAGFNLCETDSPPFPFYNSPPPPPSSPPPPPSPPPPSPPPPSSPPPPPPSPPPPPPPSSSHQQSVGRWFTFVVLGSVLCLLL